jgi:hypothetical protein
VTTPLVETEATALLELVQEIEIPLKVPPDASLAVAVSCWVRPRVRDDEAGLTVNDDTWGGGALTWIFDVPVTPPDKAVIVAEPAAIAVTTPLSDTDATPGSDEVHITVGFETGWPPLSTTATLIGIDCPACNAALLGERPTITTTLLPLVGAVSDGPLMHPNVPRSAPLATTMCVLKRLIAARILPPASVRRLDWRRSHALSARGQ